MRLIVCVTLVAIAAASLSSEAVAKNSFGTHKQKEIPDAELNCKQITGRMQVRIIQIRGYDEHKQSSNFSRSLQSVFVGTVGTSAKGLDPSGDHANDLKQLQDYNQRLVAMGCKSFNLEHDLSPGMKDTPAATVPAPKKSKDKSKGEDKAKPRAGRASTPMLVRAKAFPVRADDPGVWL